MQHPAQLEEHVEELRIALENGAQGRHRRLVASRRGEGEGGFHLIEHVDAVRNIDAILGVRGVDAVIVGTLDLSGSMGLLGQTSRPEVETAVQTVLAACRRAAKPCGIITVSAEQANQRIAQGFTLLIVGLDVLFLIGSAKGTLERIERPSPAPEPVPA